MDQCLRPLRSDRRLARETGFALVEVLVSAVVLALVALAVLAGVDVAGRSTGREKARAVAVSLAERDQERMRGIAARDVTAVSDLGPYTVNGAQYTVDSTAEWVDDATGGTESCSNSASNASYIRITSVVTSSGLGSSPVRISSLVEPPVSAAGAGEGYLAVQVADRNGTGVAAVNVHADGPTTDDVATNDAGCAVFGRVGVGSYSFTLTRAGYVDVLGRSPGQLKGVTVTQNAKTVATTKFDLAASLTPSFETSNPKTSTTISTSWAGWLSAVHTNAPALVTYGDGTQDLRGKTLSLFPFSGPYNSIFAGKCPAENPLTAVRSTYFDSGAYKGPFTADPGGSGSLLIHQPPLRVKVTNSGAGVSGAAVLVTGPCDATSDAEEYAMTTTGTAIGPGGEAGWVTRSASTYDPGLPYGAYKVCAKSGGKYAAGNITLNDPVAGNATTLTLTPSLSSAPSTPDCP